MYFSHFFVLWYSLHYLHDRISTVCSFLFLCFEYMRTYIYIYIFCVSCFLCVITELFLSFPRLCFNVSFFGANPRFSKMSLVACIVSSTSSKATIYRLFTSFSSISGDNRLLCSIVSLGMVFCVSLFPSLSSQFFHNFHSICIFRLPYLHLLVFSCSLCCWNLRISRQFARISPFCNGTT